MAWADLLTPISNFRQKLSRFKIDKNIFLFLLEKEIWKHVATLLYILKVEMPRNQKPIKTLVGIQSSQNQVQVKPQETTQNPGLLPSLGASIIHGVAVGSGSGFAHAIINRFFNSVQEKPEYSKCLEMTKNNYEACEHLNL